ncbi:OTU domain-containing protein 5 [Cimex lectularius]|uniref:ubiquitinyl hydrolase 1 n=1 Tax=Cimex lectularius TaxID=79782 RepID=A0A8I6THH7_CIMLE|nr:OTU domain-containing protein 5 [Cimex lectularius]
MTILSKKKNVQGKQDVESMEGQQHIQNPHNLPIQISNNQLSDDRIPQQCWPGGPREERHSPHHSFDEYENLESGPSHGKRRHRASPLRVARAKHRDRVGGSGSPSHCGGPSSSNLEVAGPSSSDACGYNSGDEYDYSHKAQRTEAQWIEEDRMFEKKMRKRGLMVKKMGEDGACLFRAVADQVYGDQEMHGVVRKHCMDYIALNSDYFSQYVTEDFNTYVNRKRLDCTHGNHIEMQAISEMYNRTIEVFCYGKDPINIFHGVHKSENEPIRLSYQRGSHYNSIVDPHKATIGVGLGLPSFTPGAAETNLLKDAIRQSEEFHIEQAMLEDKLRATDWEATNEAIEEQVARDSYLQYLRDNEKREKSMEMGTSSTAVDRNSPKPQSSNPEEPNPRTGEEKKFFSVLPPETFGLSEWDDAGILAQVLAESQQEYLDNLKKARTSSSPSAVEQNSLEQPSTSR